VGELGSGDQGAAAPVMDYRSSVDEPSRLALACRSFNERVARIFDWQGLLVVATLYGFASDVFGPNWRDETIGRVIASNLFQLTLYAGAAYAFWQKYRGGRRFRFRAALVGVLAVVFYLSTILYWGWSQSGTYLVIRPLHSIIVVRGGIGITPHYAANLWELPFRGVGIWIWCAPPEDFIVP